MSGGRSEIEVTRYRPLTREDMTSTELRNVAPIETKWEYAHRRRGRIAKRDGNAGGGRRRVNGRQGYDVGIQDATLNVARRNLRRRGAGLVSSSPSCGLADALSPAHYGRYWVGTYSIYSTSGHKGCYGVSSGGQENRDRGMNT